MKKSFRCAGFFGFLILAGTSCNTSQSTQSTINGNASDTLAAAAQTTGVDMEHSNRSVLDWQGRYAGTLPGPNGESVETTVFLKYSDRYVLTRHTVGQSGPPFRQEGTIAWSADEISVTLNSGGGASAGRFLVGEGQLFALDENGARRQGADAEKYILKMAPPKITGRTWNLIELAGKPVPLPAAGEQRPYFMLNEGSTKANGRGACNTFNATYEVRENVYFTMKDIGATRMACAPGNMENSFFEALTKATTYSMPDEDSLSLEPVEGKTLAKFAASR